MGTLSGGEKGAESERRGGMGVGVSAFKGREVIIRGGATGKTSLQVWEKAIK